MTTSHGKKTVLTIATKDISPFTKNSQLERAATTHNTTGYGVDDELYAGGIRNNKFTCSGVYDNTVSVGPSLVLKGVVGSILAIVRKVEGTGTGLPQSAFNAVLEKFVETSPHDDIVSWSADFQISGPVTESVQP
jgi:hypothetical protein